LVTFIVIIVAMAIIVTIFVRLLFDSFRDY
jgi:hypothetical protein